MAPSTKLTQGILPGELQIAPYAHFIMRRVVRGGFNYQLKCSLMKKNYSEWSRTHLEVSVQRILYRRWQLEVTKWRARWKIRGATLNHENLKWSRNFYQKNLLEANFERFTKFLKHENLELYMWYIVSPHESLAWDYIHRYMDVVSQARLCVIYPC